MEKKYVISVIDFDITDATLRQNHIDSDDIYYVLSQGCARELSKHAFAWTLKTYDDEEKARKDFSEYKTEFGALFDNLICLKEYYLYEIEGNKQTLLAVSPMNLDAMNKERERRRNL